MPLSKNGDLYLITVSGKDHPGITAELMRAVSASGDEVIDMGQAVTHGLLSLSFVLKINSVPENASRTPIIRDLLFLAKDMGLELEYEKIEEDLGKDTQEENLESIFVLNCVTPEKITASFIRDTATTLAKNKINIRRIDKVSPKSFSSLEITTTVPGFLDLDSVKHDLIEVSTNHKVDVAFLKDNVFRRSKRLIVFDMDSTLIQTEVIDEMAELAGVGDQVKAITEQAMNGEIDFNESLIKRVQALEGLDKAKLVELSNRLPLTEGVEEFIQTVKRLGYKVALISGGFSFFTDRLKDQLKIDYAFANELEFREDKLTGKVIGTIVNAEQKALLLKLIAQQENISLEQVVAIGDGANDLPMLSTAGLGIAFHAKDTVRKKAEQRMSHGPMTSILYFLGIPGVEDI